MHDSTCLRAKHAQAEVKFRKLTLISLWYIFVDSYAYHKLFLLILQIVILNIGKLKGGPSYIGKESFLFHLKKPPSLKVVMAKWFYHKNRYIC